MARTKTFDEKEVLNKAMELFWENGYHATSIQDLVDKLGINRASLYNTYGGKYELFNRSFEFYREINSNRIREFLATQPDPKKAFRRLFEMAIDESVKDECRKGCFVVNTTTELIPGDIEIQKKLLENKGFMEGIFYEYLLKASEKQGILIEKDLSTIAKVLFTFYSGLKVIAKIKPDKDELMNSVNSMISLLDQ
ncbi:TetR/AcrR family transcriptional regulator [Gramella lutea]|uniref:TetR/AcrR family transcriptional regulator n=1 Tax=Christiangramia lutea TaxID=1607951 RepID=A0A9X2A807_9FLAO|nr:TetR/AcrR family transcriptional regulator [Christiangramia lutea]MCH4822054.1 TetR/AcrR family transcriptional regulator [Christiangramia lutea]